MIWGTMTGPELAWTIVAAVGFGTSVLALFDALRSLHYLEAQMVYDRAREIVARGNVASEVLRLSMHAVSLIIGIIALVSPPANPDRPITTLGLVLSIGLIAIAVLLVMSSWTDRLVRERALDALVAQDHARKRLEAL
jgi:uncharacterized membrane protein HdeD (DUF308 family)